MLAFADPVHNQDALARAPVAGWLMLGAAIGLALVLFAHREGFRRLVLRAEDPRTMGAFRIAFGLCCLCNINGMWELFEYLFTDEGLFTTEVARQVVAAEQFGGFGNGLDGEPYGFFDAPAVLAWLGGPRYSLLFFWSSPRFFWCYLAVFEIAMVCTILGYRTRWMKWIAWILFHGIIQRNNVFWEGTENVYRTFFFYLCLSRCDRAYSLDNWLRLRRNPSEPIYRLIPAWPRLLVILQCAAIYCTTGAVKNGGIWWSGDAFYYALNLDHFYRVPPQGLSALLGTTLFRLNTHVVHAWETLFPVVVVGLLVRFGLRERIAISTRDRWVSRLGWLALSGFALALVLWLYPVHYVQGPKSSWSLVRVQVVFAAVWIAASIAIARLYPRLRDRPPRITIRGREHVLDLDWWLKWLFGRRLWIGLGIVFHLHLVGLMNIGWFSPGCLTGFICFLNGGELAVLFAELRRVAARIGLPVTVREPVPAEDPARLASTKDGVRIPDRALATAIAIAALGVPARVFAGVAYGWTVAAVAAFLLGALWRARRSPEPDDAPQDFAWAYRAPGRFVAGAIFVFHVVAVSVWLLPEKDSLTWRNAANKTFSHWLKLTQTTQGWKMFAPNPPRGNVMLRVLVTDADGKEWDMNTDVYAPEKRPIPWLTYTRERKINRRIAGGEGGKGVWYQKWHARWWCRHWALEHGGVLPMRVELRKLGYPIPDPKTVRERGPYDPATQWRERGTETSLYTAECATEPEAQPSDEVRARHGLPPDTAARPERWINLRNRLRAWKRKQGEAADEDAPVD